MKGKFCVHTAFRDQWSPARRCTCVLIETEMKNVIFLCVLPEEKAQNMSID